MANQVTILNTVQTNKPKFAFIPVRTIRDYQDADFIAVSEYFRNAPFTYKFLGLDYQAYRKKAQALGCYYPTSVKKGNTKVPNPKFNPAIPELKWVLSPFSKKQDSYVIDVEEADALIEQLRANRNYQDIYKADKALAPKDKAEDFINSLDSVLNAKLAAMESRICDRLDKAIGFKLESNTPEFKTYLEYKDGVSENFQDFCRFKVLGPASSPEMMIQHGDIFARRIGYPSHDEFMNLIRNYDSYNQIAKFKNVSSSVVAKWAAFWDMMSEFAKKINDNKL